MSAAYGQIFSINIFTKLVKTIRRVKNKIHFLMNNLLGSFYSSIFRMCDDLPLRATVTYKEEQPLHRWI